MTITAVPSPPDQALCFQTKGRATVGCKQTHLLFSFVSWSTIISTARIINCLLQPASVLSPDLAAQGDVRENSRVRVNSIQSVHHGLYSLDPILLTHGTTLSFVDLSKVSLSRITNISLIYTHGEINTCNHTQHVPCLQVVGGGRRTELL